MDRVIEGFGWRKEPEIHRLWLTKLVIIKETIVFMHVILMRVVIDEIILIYACNLI